MRGVIIIAASMALAVPAHAKTKYEPYEGRDTVVEGSGGTRQTKDDVDFWTHGDPPRRYQVIGIITDKRGTGLAHGNAIGSSGIAKKVKEAGGNAVIVLNRNESVAGYVGGGSAQAYGGSGNAYGWMAPVRKNTTVLAVVKYLDGPTP